MERYLLLQLLLLLFVFGLLQHYLRDHFLWRKYLSFHHQVVEQYFLVLVVVHEMILYLCAG